MNKIFLKVIIAIFLATAPLLISAQPPAHPNGGKDPGSGNDPVGGGAPIESGICIMIILGAGYGVNKLYKEKKSFSVDCLVKK